LPDTLPCHNSILHLSPTPSTPTASFATHAIFFLNPSAAPTHHFSHTLPIKFFFAFIYRASLFLFWRKFVSSHGKHHSRISRDGFSTTVARITKLVTLQRLPEHHISAIRSPFLYTDGPDHTGIAQLSLATFALFGPPCRRFLHPHQVHALTPTVDYSTRPARSHTVQSTCNPPLSVCTKRTRHNYSQARASESSAVNIHSRQLPESTFLFPLH